MATRIGDWSIVPTADDVGLSIKCCRPDGTWLSGEICLRTSADNTHYVISVYADNGDDPVMSEQIFYKALKA